MKTAVYAVVLSAFLLAQFTLSNFSSIFGVKPDLTLTLILCASLIRNERYGAFSGLLIGIIEDALFGNFLGLNMIAKSAAGYIIGFISKNLYKGLTIITMAVVFIGTVAFNFIFLILNFATGNGVFSWNDFFRISTKSALLNMIISPFVYHILLKTQRFLDYYFDTKF